MYGCRKQYSIPGAVCPGPTTGAAAWAAGYRGDYDEDHAQTENARDGADADTGAALVQRRPGGGGDLFGHRDRREHDGVFGREADPASGISGKGHRGAGDVLFGQGGAHQLFRQDGLCPGGGSEGGGRRRRQGRHQRRRPGLPDAQHQGPLRHAVEGHPALRAHLDGRVGRGGEGRHHRLHAAEIPDPGRRQLEHRHAHRRVGGPARCGHRQVHPGLQKGQLQFQEAGHPQAGTGDQRHPLGFQMGLHRIERQLRLLRREGHRTGGGHPDAHPRPDPHPRARRGRAPGEGDQLVPQGLQVCAPSG